MTQLDVPIPSMPEGQSILVVMAHPDDAEFGCGGTIAKWAAAGKIVNYVLCTSGDKGSSDPDISPFRLAQTRRTEQMNAARALGAHEVTFLEHADGTLQNTIGLRRDIVREIRRYRPDAVICQDPTQRWSGHRYLNHPDHRAAGDACLDAIYPSARDPHVFSELLIENLLPHKVREVFMMSTNAPDVIVDISDWIDRKMAGLAEHKSQVGANWEQVLDRVKGRAHAVAQSANVPYEHAEAFKYFLLD